MGRLESLSGGQFELFLSVGAWICAVAAVLNLINLKRRGNAALFLSSAFLVFGGILWLLKIGAGVPYIAVAAIVLAALLIGDAVLKLKKQQDSSR
jgi:hypothetical protein